MIALTCRRQPQAKGRIHAHRPGERHSCASRGAVLAHDARTALPSIQAPTLITFGRHDTCTSTRFAGPLTEGIAGSEVTIFEDCAHAAIYENVEEFNGRTLAFLNRHTG